VRNLFERRTLRYDKSGEQHYDLISAFIKSMRGSDPQAAIYYFARMYEAGEDPRFLARRMIIFASEDIGNADPRALELAISGATAFERIGDAEGWIPLSQVVIYLATAPKSNASYAAYKAAVDAIDKTGDLDVPLALRNAATKMMGGLGYGKGYEYAHQDPDAVVRHAHLPQDLVGQEFYQPTDRGYEKTIRERQAQIALIRLEKSKKL
jgi:putative ATPase